MCCAASWGLSKRSGSAPSCQGSSRTWQRSLPSTVSTPSCWAACTNSRASYPVVVKSSMRRWRVLWEVVMTRPLTWPRHTGGAASRAHACVSTHEHLKRSNLLLRGLCSTVPGLVQVRDRTTLRSHDGCRDRWHRPASGLMRRGPQARKNLGPTGLFGLATLHQFERLITELIHTRIRVAPAMG